MGQMPSVSRAKQVAKSIFGIIEEKSKIDPDQKGVQCILSGGLEFKNVMFRYPSRQKFVLRNFNLKIQPNQSVAIVGPSGSGKSTIASLIMRLYDVEHGQITFDNQDIKSLEVRSLRQNIGIVQQEPLLFNESIKNNILFGDLNASDQQVKMVAE